MRKGLWWRWWVAGGVLATAGYYLVPGDTLGSTVLYDAIGLLAGVAMLVGVRLFRPARPAMWYWFAGGQFMSVLGDVVWSYYVYWLDRSPYPSVADVFYLGSYPMLIIGLVLLVRGRGKADAGHLVDAAIVATGLGLVFWVFVLQPTLSDSAHPWLDRVISTAYPATDALLLTLLARLYTGAGRRDASTRLLGLGAVALLAADVCFSLTTLYWEADTRSFDGLFLLSYLLWAAAALHPSMAAGADPKEDRHPPVGLVRLAVFGACSLVAPVLLFLPGIGDDLGDRLAVAVGAIALFLLVIARMAGFMRRVQRQSAELGLLAMIDDLTGLANRRQFEQALRAALRDGGRPQVALLGLNGFKNVNDELGRPIGDTVLGLLAERIGRAAPADALVARIGGDEFAVLLAHANAGQVRTMAMALTDALRAPVQAGGHELLVGVGIGLAGGAGTDPVELLRQAEAAMYAAKQTGEPYRRWTPVLDDRAGEHARLGAEMRTGLDAGQFRVVYQPIVEMPSGRVAAVEALVRWEHPERGLISPVHFVPVAERNGLIVELGEWILRTSCVRLMRWRAELGSDAPDRVSVNVSARQLARPGFARTVAAALTDSGLPAECLAIEVTETAVFEGGQAVITLHELRALGVWIALDDFGTGHSSLGLLQTVPVDILKVDKSFVDRITEAGRHAVIAEALIQVSAGLGLTAVAEGVETAEQAAALQGLGYRLLQGYHFGRPSADPLLGAGAAELLVQPVA